MNKKLLWACELGWNVWPIIPGVMVVALVAALVRGGQHTAADWAAWYERHNCTTEPRYRPPDDEAVWYYGYTCADGLSGVSEYEK